MLVNITVNNVTYDFQEKVSDEFGDLIRDYNFKDMEEVNQVLQWDDRCRLKNHFDWCPKDSEELRKYLTR